MVTKKKFKFLKINQINFKPKKLLWTQQEYGKNQLKGVWFPTTYINETKIKVESHIITWELKMIIVLVYG